MNNCQGRLPLFTFERARDIDNDEPPGIDCIGGVIMQQMGDQPEEGLRIQFPLFDAVVKKMNGPRVFFED